MRHVYLRPCDSGHRDSSRGGVSSRGDDFELEIGQTQNASVEMLVHCALIDEIHEFLQKANSPLAALILQRYREAAEELETRLAEHRVAAERSPSDVGREIHEQTLLALAARFGPDCLGQVADPSILENQP